MARFKLNISSADGKSKAMDLEGADAQPLIGKRIGEAINGSMVGLEGKKLLITGGSDMDGFPMRKDVHGGARKSIILSGGTGFRSKVGGERRRKGVRGNVITDNIVQVNTKILEEEEGGENHKNSHSPEDEEEG